MSTSDQQPPRPGSGATRPGRRRLGLSTATALVIASMVGTGVFTTTGLVVSWVPSTLGVLGCWLVAGLGALGGALAYAELGAALPHNGGEYHFLSRLIHPSVGFASAWVSLIVGFAAPLAAIALAFGQYAAAVVPGIPPRLAGALLILLLSALHAWRVGAGAGVQNALTLGKLLLVLGFIAVGIWQLGPAALIPDAGQPSLGPVTTSGFAVGLLLVSFSYFGWGAAAYVAGEVRDPARVMPRSLLLGTSIVLGSYLALNAVFLAAVPLAELRGRVEVGHVAAVALLGPGGGRVLAGAVALGLVSTVGALIVTGARVYEAVGTDVPRLGWLGRRGRDGGPWVAIAVQSTLALAMLVTSGFEALLTYVGFTLSLFAAVCVSALFVLRARPEIARPYCTPGYPVTPLLFVALMLGSVVGAVAERPLTAALGGATLLVGFALHAALGARAGRPASAEPGGSTRPGAGAAAGESGPPAEPPR